MSWILLISDRPDTLAFFRGVFSPEDRLFSVKDESLAEILLQDTGVDIILAEETSAEFLRKAANLALLVAVGGDDPGVPGVFYLRKKEEYPAVRGLLRAALDRITSLETENGRLRKKIDDIALVSRAKRVLQKTLGMTEEQAHRYLEKQAMDLRSTKTEVARRVLATYTD
jgi:hypothetical protein